MRNAFIYTCIVIAAVAVTAFYWNEAKKEVMYLCGNFIKGVAESSVRRQLDTGNLLRYRSENSASGSRIEVDSLYNFKMYKCIIELDVNGKVMSAGVE